MKKYITGSIRKIIFESNSGPYKVGLFRVKESSEEFDEYIGKVIGFTGSFTDINMELDYTLYGDMVEHPKYGLQFSSTSYEIKEPSDSESLILYLSSGMFKGIGVKTAKKIVERFGSDTLDIIKHDYEKLATVSGVNMSKALELHEKITDSEMNQDLIIKLNSYGFSVKEAIDLISIYGYELTKIVENNIYELIDYVSFDKLDLIYLKSNDEDSSNRIEALIKHNIYNMCYETGDTLISIEELFLNMKKCFKKNFDVDKYMVHLNKLIDSHEIIKVGELVELYEFNEAENGILRHINIINSIKNYIENDRIESCITKYEKKYDIKFGEEQVHAIKGALKNNFYIITGGPGTGKTTIIKAIVEILEELMRIKHTSMALLAPTGRSAKRMCESVGISAYTIHKFLKWNKETETFAVDEYNKALESVIIVDEASMIDVNLFYSLLKGLRMDVKLLLIGDANQLPSIGPGDVLNDLLNISNIKSTCLNTIYRVKEGSYITYFANDIKSKKIFDKFDDYSDFKFLNCSDEDILPYLREICSKVKEKNLGLDNFQVLAPMYKGYNGIDSINNMMADIFNPDNKKYQVGDKYYRINDKVIQLVNDVENNVFNGDIGYIEDIYYVDKKLKIIINYMGNKIEYQSGDFDKFNLAYAISIHKSQGSEYDNVIIILASSFKRMFYNKLIYTGVTRAKKSLMIIGNINSLNDCVQTLYAVNRKTYLKNV